MYYIFIYYIFTYCVVFNFVYFTCIYPPLQLLLFVLGVWSSLVSLMFPCTISDHLSLC